MLLWIVTKNFSRAEEMQSGAPPQAAVFPATWYTAFQSF